MDLPCRGLSTEEVAERRRAGFANVTTPNTTKSVGKIIADNLLTYFNLFFLIITILLITAGSEIRNLTFIPIVLANSLIGIIQELRAKKVLDELHVLNTPISRAIRNGKLERIPITELVKDDIIFLKAGDQISADAEVITGEVSVNEALLTGEADEIKKVEKSKLMSGSFVVYGECYARLTNVGDSSYAAQLTLKAKAIKTEEESQIIKDLNKYVKVAGITVAPLGIIMMVERLLRGASYRSATESMAAVTISMIPQGLFLLASATLVLSAMRLARKKVLLHDMKSIETLARADILCVDKTGTITSGKMKLNNILWISDLVAGKSAKSDKSKNPAASDIKAILASTIDSLPSDSETMEALKKAQSPLLKKVRALNFTPKKIQGFSSKLKHSGVDFGPEIGTFVLGAPELVLRKNYRPTLKKRIDKLAGEGFRVLIFAKYTGELKDKPLTAKAIPFAIITLEDEIRESAAETFKYFSEQQVEIKVISGDSPLTVSAVARRAGIKNADKFIDLSQPFSEKKLQKIANEYTIFGRVTPEGKRALIKALQASGHTVAMTGDGVNDVLALKDADCSIAMASGAHAAASAAQMVLLDSDFSRMPSIVTEGRRVVNNLERSGSLFIVKNLFSFVAAVLVILLGISYPMVPAQVSLVTLWAIGVPSFLLAQIPNTKLIRGNFLQNILKSAIPTTITAILLISITNIIARALHIDARFLGSISTLIWAGIALIHLLIIAYPYNKLSLTICIACLAGAIFSALIMKPLFAIEASMGIVEWLLVLIPIALAFPIIIFGRYILRRFDNGISHRR